MLIEWTGLINQQKYYKYSFKNRLSNICIEIDTWSRVLSTCPTLVVLNTWVHRLALTLVTMCGEDQKVSLRESMEYLE